MNSHELSIQIKKVIKKLKGSEIRSYIDADINPRLPSVVRAKSG